MCNCCNLLLSQSPFAPDAQNPFHVSGQTNHLAAGLEHAVVHVRSAGSFRSESTLAEVSAQILCNSCMQMNVDNMKHPYLDTVTQLVELCLPSEDLHLSGCDKKPASMMLCVAKGLPDSVGT